MSIKNAKFSEKDKIKKYRVTRTPIHEIIQTESDKGCSLETITKVLKGCGFSKVEINGALLDGIIREFNL